MRIVVDRSRCAGIGICEALAPDIFEVDAGGDLVLLSETVPDGMASDVDEAVESCPTAALSLRES